MNSKWQRAGQQVKPGLKIVGKLALLTALRYGPAGVAAGRLNRSRVGR